MGGKGGVGNVPACVGRSDSAEGVTSYTVLHLSCTGNVDRFQMCGEDQELHFREGTACVPTLSL